MMPKFHLAFGLVSSLIISLIFGFGYLEFFIIFLTSVFLDLDHTLRYSIKTKNFSPFKFWKWSAKEREERERYSGKCNKPIFIFKIIVNL